MRRAFLLLALVVALGCKTSTKLADAGGLLSIDPDGGAFFENAALNLDKSTVNLGALDVGVTGVATVTVTNTGRVASGVLVVTSSAGVTATGCSDSLSAGASCTLTITATPTAAGGFSGTVLITANPGAITPLVVFVIAPGGFGEWSVTPSAFDLGDITVGVATPKQTITITAKGAPLGDLAIGTSGADVSIDKAATTCTATLATNTSCVVVVDFLATTCGSKSDAIVLSAGGANGKIVTLPITARALPPVHLVISPSTRQAFADGATLTFGVANSGDTPTGLVTAAVTGPYAFDFTITNSTCLVLAPLAGCTISIAYHPVSVDAGAGRIASLVVTDAGTCDSSVAVALVDTHYVALALYPSTTELFSALVGTTGTTAVFTVVNDGDVPSGALGVGTSSIEFLVANDTCSGATIIPNGSCTFSLAFKPVTAGPPRTATLTVSDGTSTVERAVTGLGGPAP